MGNNQPLQSEALELAAGHRMAGRYQEAEGLCRQILQRSPDCAPAWHLLGLIRSDSGDASEAIQSLTQAVALDATQAAYFKALADVYAAMGDSTRAIQSYRDALRLKHDYFEVHSNLAGALLDTALYAESIDHYQEAIRLRPDIAELHDNLGNALRVAGYAESAIACHQEALRLKPALLAARINIGSALIKLGRLREAVESLESALKLAPNIAEIHFNLAVALSGVGRADSALKHYETAARLRPDNLDAVAGEVSVLTELGDHEAASRRIEPYAAMRERNSNIALAFASLARDADQRRASVASLERLIECGLCHADERRRIHFRLAELLDQLECYDLAFEHYQQGNELKPHHFDRREYHGYVERIISAFAERNLSALAHAKNDSELPVFIVGLPRSGKTLIEQILAAHPQVMGAGELPDISDMIRTLERQTGKLYPLHMDGLTAEQLSSMADEYLSGRRAEVLPGTLRVMDTMPFNVEHLGFISLLFPRARIIHCQRDPRDTCLECYFKDFGAGHSYANNLEDLGHRYLEYRRLSKHWIDVLGLSQLEVRYEELVQTPEVVSRRLVDFLGLEWQPQCLAFHAPGVARLTGKAHFREPINDRAVGRWKNYRQHLQPLFESLQQ